MTILFVSLTSRHDRRVSRRKVKRLTSFPNWLSIRRLNNRLVISHLQFRFSITAYIIFWLIHLRNAAAWRQKRASCRIVRNICSKLNFPFIDRSALIQVILVRLHWIHWNVSCTLSHSIVLISLFHVWRSLIFIWQKIIHFLWVFEIIDWFYKAIFCVFLYEVFWMKWPNNFYF